jgi:co-chaperonin GroES (HSP10)
MRMAIQNNFRRFQSGLSLGLFLSLVGITNSGIAAQTPTAAPPAAASQLGTVKAVSGNTITMTTDKGLTLSVSVATGAKVVQLAVGSTDLKTAKPSQLTDVAVGDRALVTGKVGDTPESFTAMRVILMKSADIAQKQAAQQDDWKARGTSGIVSTVDPATGIINITSGTKKLTINTSSKTEFRRFAGDTVKYQDAKLGTLAQIQPKDQLQARGTKSADGSSMQAEEVISGSFENLSGVLLSVDSASGKITLKDLASKKIVTVNVTANSDLRTMPAMMATRFAAQANGGGQGGGRRGGGSGGGTAQETSGGSGRSAGADLSQMIARLPTITLADLHKGDAVMIVASESAPGATTVTAVTMLSGVDAILTANPNGGMDLSMSVSSGGSE